VEWKYEQANKYISIFILNTGAFMLDNITFIDLTALMRITPDATVERFGGLINSSFFDASNILGTLKQKGLVDFITQFPSQSAITVTDEGKKLIAEVQERAANPFDELDHTILTQLSKGNRTLVDLSANVNVTSKDLAVHLNKLSVQQFISYELRNGNMTINLTEKGFLRVKEGVPPSEVPAQQVAGATGAVQPNAATPSAKATAGPTVVGIKIPSTPEEFMALETKIMNDEKTRSMAIFAAIIIFVLIFVLLYFLHLV